VSDTQNKYNLYLDTNAGSAIQASSTVFTYTSYIIQIE
jgi:hypothetical protein